MVLLVLVALGLLSSLALGDALRASRAAAVGEDALQARAAAVGGLARLAEPPDLPWLCLQPPAAPLRAGWRGASGDSVELTWWMLPEGIVRAQSTGFGANGARARRLAWLRPDSLPLGGPGLGCPGARRLRPADTEWLTGHPEG